MAAALSLSRWMESFSGRCLRLANCRLFGWEAWGGDAPSLLHLNSESCLEINWIWQNEVENVPSRIVAPYFMGNWIYKKCLHAPTEPRVVVAGQYRVLEMQSVKLISLSTSAARESERKFSREAQLNKNRFVLAVAEKLRRKKKKKRVVVSRKWSMSNIM